MGIFDGLAEQLTPHAFALNETISSHGDRIHQRLQEISHGVSDLGKPDTGDKRFRVAISTILGATETVNIGPNGNNGTVQPLAVPINEFWFAEFITVVSGKNVVINTNGIPLIAAAATPSSQSLSGNFTFLPGETLTLSAEASTVIVTLGLIRRQIPGSPVHANKGIAHDLVAGLSNTHEIQRDEIAATPGPWTESPPETRNAEGRPPLVSGVDPTAV